MGILLHDVVNLPRLSLPLRSLPLRSEGVLDPIAEGRREEGWDPLGGGQVAIVHRQAPECRHRCRGFGRWQGGGKSALSSPLSVGESSPHGSQHAFRGSSGIRSCCFAGLGWDIPRD